MEASRGWPRAALWVDYQGKLSVLLDRIDLCIDVLGRCRRPRLPPPAERSADVAARIAAAGAVQRERLAALDSGRSYESGR